MSDPLLFCLCGIVRIWSAGTSAIPRESSLKKDQIRQWKKTFGRGKMRKGVSDLVEFITIRWIAAR